jgi:hypothetical protein
MGFFFWNLSDENWGGREQRWGLARKRTWIVLEMATPL